MQKRFLSEETRKAIIQMRIDGRGPQEISEILGVNPNTVARIYTRHLKRTQSAQTIFLGNDEPETPGIDWQAKWCEAQQQIAELKEINSILKGYVRHLQRLNEQ
jgi:transposase-like protein